MTEESSVGTCGSQASRHEISQLHQRANWPSPRGSRCLCFSSLYNFTTNLNMQFLPFPDGKFFKPQQLPHRHDPLVPRLVPFSACSSSAEELLSLLLLSTEIPLSKLPLFILSLLLLRPIFTFHCLIAMSATLFRILSLTQIKWTRLVINLVLIMLKLNRENHGIQ